MNPLHTRAMKQAEAAIPESEILRLVSHRESLRQVLSFAPPQLPAAVPESLHPASV